MIKSIIIDNLQPSPQFGQPVIFKRRKPEESNISGLVAIKEIYDYIRMLDCEGYPSAFLETNHFRFEFSKAVLSDNNEIVQAYVRIIEK
jgi:methionyl-tRNA formyltransferase